LASADAARAYQAVCALVAASRQAVGGIKSHLRPPAGSMLKRIQQLIADLESDRFEVRQSASRELEKVGGAAHSALRQALSAKPSLETRRRLEALLEKPALVRDPEELRGTRAVQVLEAIGTREARQVLESLSTGVPGARLTQEATASLERLAGRAAAKP
jgi:hypothetical protein